MAEILYENLTREQLHTYRLVLDAYNLPYVSDETADGGRIWVEQDVYGPARNLVAQYILENPEEVGPAQPLLPPMRRTYSAVWIVLVLSAAHWIIHTADDVAQIIDVYGASAARILQGEVYRAATALMIHADLPHLVGNLAAIALLGTLVCAITGAGVGWLIILLSGISGNLINAFFFQHSHLSVGASTAVFGALGFLAAFQFQRKRSSIRRDQRKKAWLPLAGGLALLGFLGTARHADLMAHLFGMLAGICFGILYARLWRPHIKEKYQAYCVAALVVITALSWMGPFHILKF